MARGSGLQLLLLSLVICQVLRIQNAWFAAAGRDLNPALGEDLVEDGLVEDDSEGLSPEELRWGRNRYELNFGVELAPLEREIELKTGLAWGHYTATCSKAQSIVNHRVKAFLKKDKGVAAGMVRLFFHDCFVQGCDASILLKTNTGSELDAIPNRTIRTIALQLVDDIKSRIEAVCPHVVSCADIIVMATQQTVEQTGGPSFNVPLGRKDGLFVSSSTSDLPGPFTTFAQQSAAFNRKGLSNTDLVALVGAHTLGAAHCGAFASRLIPNVDPKLNPSYAKYLKENVCPTLQSTNSTALDFYSPNKFDNQFFKNLPTGGALLASDQNLDQDATAFALVKKWADSRQAFFDQFAKSFIKMSQIDVITTGVYGEVRKKCSSTNQYSVSEVVDQDTPIISMVVDKPAEV